MARTGNTVVVIGLGVMGAPMAANLIDAGYDAVGFNRSQGKVETHVAPGDRGASSIAEAVEGADVVLTVVPDTPDVDLGTLGIVSAAARDAGVAIPLGRRQPSCWVRCGLRGTVARTTARCT
jgi:2-hydroxy-3-oxopropionate reductase